MSWSWVASASLFSVIFVGSHFIFISSFYVLLFFLLIFCCFLSTPLISLPFTPHHSPFVPHALPNRASRFVLARFSARVS